jgi:hypothetical protein
VGSAIVKLVESTMADTVTTEVTAGATQVGVDGRLDANDSGISMMRDAVLAAVVFTV